MPSMRLPELSGRREQSEEGDSRHKKTTPNKNQGKDKETFDGSSDDIEFDGGIMEDVITEDMLEFLEKSIRHKLTLSMYSETNIVKLQPTLNNSVQLISQVYKTEEIKILYCCVERQRIFSDSSLNKPPS